MNLYTLKLRRLVCLILENSQGQTLEMCSQSPIDLHSTFKFLKKKEVFGELSEPNQPYLKIKPPNI